MNVRAILSVDDISTKPENMEHIEKLIALVNEFNIKPTLFVIPLHENKYSILDFPTEKYEDLINNSEFACHGLTHTSKDGENSNEMKNITLEEFDSKIGRAIDLIKDKFGKKPSGYKAPGWQMERGQDDIVKKHFKWMQINKLEAACFYIKEFFYFPITYPINDVGLYMPQTVFFTSHMTNHNNKNVISLENYLDFRSYLKIMKERKFNLRWLTLSEMREEVISKR